MKVFITSLFLCNDDVSNMPVYSNTAIFWNGEKLNYFPKGFNLYIYIQKSENCWESLAAVAVLKVNDIMKKGVTTGYRDDLSIV